jgi:hypothetical protein
LYQPEANDRKSSRLFRHPGQAQRDPGPGGAHERDPVADTIRPRVSREQQNLALIFGFREKTPNENRPLQKSPANRPAPVPRPV